MRFTEWCPKSEQIESGYSEAVESVVIGYGVSMVTNRKTIPYSRWCEHEVRRLKKKGIKATVVERGGRIAVARS